MSTSSVLDVVIPAFNAAATLPAAVRSALSCAVVGRVIVVDDGSDPPLESPDPRAELIRQANAGPGAARNRGMEASTASHVLFLDADDVLLPGVGDAVKLMDRLGAVAVVSGWLAAPAGAVLTEGRRRHPPEEWVGGLLTDRAEVFQPIHLFKGSGIMVHRRVVDAGVRFDESLRVGEDREFLYRAGALGGIAVCDAAVVGYAMHGEEGENLSSPRRFDRRVHDFGTIVRRHHNEQTTHYLWASGMWLANQLARRGASAETWGALMQLFREYGWKPSLKARVRRWTRRGRGG